MASLPSIPDKKQVEIKFQNHSHVPPLFYVPLLIQSSLYAITYRPTENSLFSNYLTSQSSCLLSVVFYNCMINDTMKRELPNSAE